jgi:serine protease
MKTNLNLLLIFLFFFVSCKKEDTTGLTNKVYDNGPLSTGNLNSATPQDAAPAGTNWSELQLTNTYIGYSAESYISADDFIVPSGESWKIDSIKTYCYKSGYTLAVSPVYATRIRIWKGEPDQVGSVVVVGDTSTNVLKSSTSSKLYRINKGSNTLTREIWENTSAFNSAISLTLIEGVYWLEIVHYAGGGGLTYFPPVTVVGQLNKSGANALQKDRSGGFYTKIKDDEAVQDIPFKIFYRK